MKTPQEIVPVATHPDVAPEPFFKWKYKLNPETGKNENERLSSCHFEF
jgi:hypothetical protein